MPSILIDTQCWLWAMEDPSRFRPETRKLIEDQTNEIFFSAASSWEILIKTSLGKLALPEDSAQYISSRIREENFTELAIEVSHTLALSKLPMHHKDPFDRILIAQSISENIPILTSDKIFKKYPVQLIKP